MFTDIKELASKCKFRDCTHSSEPNCAVQKAINDGILSAKWYEKRKKIYKEKVKKKEGRKITRVGFIIR